MINISNKRIPVVKFDPVKNEKISHLSIRIDTFMLEGYNRKYTGDGWFPRFQWSTCFESSKDETLQFAKLCEWDGLKDEYCLDYGYDDIDDFKNKIFTIMKVEWNKKTSIPHNNLLGGGISTQDNYYI